MAESLSDHITRSLQAAEHLYHRLVLLVGQASSGKTRVLNEIADRHGAPVINVNLALASELLELTATQRSLRLPNILGEIAETAPSLLVLNHLEILFDPHLQQDPLRLLQGISRHRVVLASWNGRWHAGRLLYAEVGHPEYRDDDRVDALIIDMDGATHVGSAHHHHQQEETECNTQT